MKMSGIEKVRVHENDVYLRRGKLGYRIVKPIKNEDGSYNYPNLLFGGWANLVRLIVILLLVAVLYYGVQDLLSSYKEIVASPCDYCIDCFTPTRLPDGSIPMVLNYSNISS